MEYLVRIPVLCAVDVRERSIGLNSTLETKNGITFEANRITRRPGMSYWTLYYVLELLQGR